VIEVAFSGIASVPVNCNGSFTQTIIERYDGRVSGDQSRSFIGGFSQIGVACATAESGKRYWCVTFGLPARR
jgi:hypothetical protein